MRDETLVARILEAVVRAIPHTPVTLKFRTGWDHTNRNAADIARIAEKQRYPPDRHSWPYPR